MKLMKKRLIFMGAGTLVGMFSGSMAKKMLDKQIPKYSKEVGALGLVGAGSLLMTKGDKQFIHVGAGIGSTGIAMLGNSVYNKVAKSGSQSAKERRNVEGGGIV